MEYWTWFPAVSQEWDNSFIMPRDRLEMPLYETLNEALVDYFGSHVVRAGEEHFEELEKYWIKLDRDTDDPFEIQMKPETGEETVLCETLTESHLVPLKSHRKDVRTECTTQVDGTKFVTAELDEDIDELSNLPKHDYSPDYWTRLVRIRDGPHKVGTFYHLLEKDEQYGPCGFRLYKSVETLLLGFFDSKTSYREAGYFECKSVPYKEAKFMINEYGGRTGMDYDDNYGFHIPIDDNDVFAVQSTKGITEGTILCEIHTDKKGRPTPLYIHRARILANRDYAVKLNDRADLYFMGVRLTKVDV